MVIRVRSDDLAGVSAVVVASVPLDDDAWVLLAPGELISVAVDPTIIRTSVLDPDHPDHPDHKEK